MPIFISAFQIVKELISCTHSATIWFKKTKFKLTLKVKLKFGFFLYYEELDGGAKQDRTADLLRARQALSQLSYSPIRVSSISLSYNLCEHS